MVPGLREEVGLGAGREKEGDQGRGSANSDSNDSTNVKTLQPKSPDTLSPTAHHLTRTRGRHAWQT